MGRACAMTGPDGRRYTCPIEYTLSIIGGKWKPVILYMLGTDGTMRFSELKRAMETISQKMLTQQLRELEADAMVRREVYPQAPPKVEYSLTELGESIMPVLLSLCRWGTEYARTMTAAAEKESGGREQATAVS